MMCPATVKPAVEAVLKQAAVQYIKYLSNWSHKTQKHIESLPAEMSLTAKCHISD